MRAEFVAMSQTVGANPAYVQGGGGNTSVKLDSRRMAIKASGLALSQVTATGGYVEVDYAAIRAGSPPSALPGGDPALRPSMETGFHALLGTHVLHTHNIYANLLTCAEEGEGLAHELFPDAPWIGYVTPGEPLTAAIAAKQPDPDAPAILFLQNHGVIASAPTAAEALRLHEGLTARILAHFKLSPVTMPERIETPDLAAMRAHVLFPDQVVYTSPENDLLHTRAARETFWAYAYIRDTIQSLGLTPRDLPQGATQTILNLPSEKHRLAVAARKETR